MSLAVGRAAEGFSGRRGGVEPVSWWRRCCAPCLDKRWLEGVHTPATRGGLEPKAQRDSPSLRLVSRERKGDNSDTRSSAASFVVGGGAQTWEAAGTKDAAVSYQFSVACRAFCELCIVQHELKLAIRRWPSFRLSSRGSFRHDSTPPLSTLIITIFASF